MLTVYQHVSPGRIVLDLYYYGFDCKLSLTKSGKVAACIQQQLLSIPLIQNPSLFKDKQ